MAKSSSRQKTDYPGVVFRINSKNQKIFYIRYKRPGERKVIEDKLSGNGWTASKANTERSKRIAEIHPSNREKRERIMDETASKKWTLNDLWENYLESKGNIPGMPSDISRWKNFIEPKFGRKLPSELKPLDIEELRRKMVRTHKTASIRYVIGLIRRVIIHGSSLRLCQNIDLEWKTLIPKADGDTERIEVLSKEQFQSLHAVWKTYPDKHIVNIHRLIAWSGMRPSEALKIKKTDINPEETFLNKRKTKSGKNIHLRLSQKVLEIIHDQKKLLEESPVVMRDSTYLFPGPKGFERKLVSYSKHFAQIRNLAGIPSNYRPNYCLRDTVATMLLSNGASLAEVGYQLGHELGSKMARRYAKYIPEAQEKIVQKSQESLLRLLSSCPPTLLSRGGHCPCVGEHTLKS